jgi:hypothetical protein
MDLHHPPQGPLRSYRAERLSTLDATAIHGDTEANRIQAGHPPRRSRPSTELL